MAKYWGLRGSKLNAAIWGVSCFCIMIFGYNQAVAGGLLTTPSFQEQFPEIDTINATGPEEAHRAQIQGTTLAIFVLLGTFGALACTFLGDIWGRRATIFTATTVQLVGVVLQGSSFQYAQLVVARIILGLGTGGIIATTSVWQAELSKPHSRGEHVSGFGIFAGMGLSLALWIDFGCHFSSTAFAWRFPLLIEIILSVVVMSTIFTLPESPRWLVKMGRVDEAREIFGAVYETEPNSPTVNSLIRDIQLSLELSRTVSLKGLFVMGPERTFHRVVLAAVIQMYLQMTGVNAITSYASTIYEANLGFPLTEADILAAASQLVIILGSVVASFTVDRYGRRFLMLTSATGMAVCQICLTGLGSMPNNKAALDASVFFLYMYYFVYTLGFLGVPFLYASEVAPIHLRAAVCGVSTAVSWLFNFLVVEVTPIAFATIGYKYFIVFAAINASCIPVVYFFYPETAGRSLEEIDEIFAASKSIFDPVRVARKLPKNKPLSEFLVDQDKVDANAVQVEEAGRDPFASAEKAEV